MAEYNMPQYILREFKVTDARVSPPNGHTVIGHFQNSVEKRNITDFYFYLFSKAVKVILLILCSLIT